MDKSDRQRLLHIRQHCTDVSEFIRRFGEDYDTFENDRVFFNAVAMSILQIGELSGGLSAEFRNSTAAEMPWAMIRGMRNLLAHAYGEIDAVMLWDTARNDIPKVLEFCERYLQDNE